MLCCLADVASIATSFGARMSRVRLMRLRAGGRILRHRDPLQDIARGLVRLHVPVTTNPGVRFLVNERRITMQPGETWHIDVRFPHEVHNAGDEDRVVRGAGGDLLEH